MDNPYSAYTTLEKLDIAKQALRAIVEEKWGGRHVGIGNEPLFCHPEGCESPEIARQALRDIEAHGSN